jgi:hypothetical protein
MICVVQKCIIDPAEDKPVISPLLKKLEAYSSRTLHFNLQGFPPLKHFPVCWFLFYYDGTKTSFPAHETNGLSDSVSL